MDAQADYPNKPINFIVPYDTGGGAGGNIGTELMNEVFLENESSMFSEGMKLYFFPKLLSNIKFWLVRR